MFSLSFRVKRKIFYVLDYFEMSSLCEMVHLGITSILSQMFKNFALLKCSRISNITVHTLILMVGRDEGIADSVGAKKGSFMQSDTLEVIAQVFPISTR